MATQRRRPSTRAKTPTRPDEDRAVLLRAAQSATHWQTQARLLAAKLVDAEGRLDGLLDLVRIAQKYGEIRSARSDQSRMPMTPEQES